MNKIIVSSLIALVVFGAQIASAQSYYPASAYSGGCLNLAADLSYGASSEQVTQLQTFLVAQNYPGGGAWMETGYFGSATLQAVHDFQQAEGLPVSGVADASTRAAIASVSCGSSGTSLYNYTAPYAYAPAPLPYTNYVATNPNCSSVYPYSCTNYNYGTGSTVALISLSQNTGAPGTSVTVYGTGFDPADNTVFFGTQVLSGIPSNGTSLTFTVPAYYSYSSYGSGTSVQFYVTDSRGTSNSLSFTVMQYGYGSNGCGSYQYGAYSGSPCSNCGSVYNGYTSGSCYTQPINANLTSPIISYLAPTSGGAGASVTVYGSGFSSAGNTVHFGQGVITGLQSSDGQSVSFVVPSSLTGFGSQVLVLGTYNVSVSNSLGYTSNVIPFTVTSLANSGTAPTITSVNGPTSLAIGTQGTWTITINNPSNSYVTTSIDWGDGEPASNQVAPQTTYAQSAATLTFTHTYYAAGTYSASFTVSNGSGQQNVSTATVYVSGSGTTGAPTLSYLSPASGSVGTQVILQGSGFSTLDNTIHFGAGGTQHVPSSGGTALYYTIPAYISPCDVIASGQVCAQYIQQVTPGSYPIYVTDSQGTSQTLTFQVQ
jgi:peptidoglycan hydrolase-like protein with peptidoglycan-binding domain